MDNSYEAMNCTELEECYFEKFGYTASCAPRESLLHALRTGEGLKDFSDPINIMRCQLSELIAEKWENIQMQLKCGGLCSQCPKGRVIDCWLTNSKHLGGSEMSDVNLNVQKQHSIEEMEEAGAFNNRVWLLQYLQFHGEYKNTELLSKTTPEVGNLVRKLAVDAPDVGSGKEEEEKPKAKPKSKGKSNKKSKKTKKESSKSKAAVENVESFNIDDRFNALHSEMESVREEIDTVNKAVYQIAEGLNLVLEDLTEKLKYMLLATAGPEFIEGSPFEEEEDEE